jgi:hypothetical protein
MASGSSLATGDGIVPATDAAACSDMCVPLSAKAGPCTPPVSAERGISRSLPKNPGIYLEALNAFSNFRQFLPLMPTLGGT